MAKTKAPRTLIEWCAARAITANGGDPTSLLDGLRSTRQAMRVCQLIIEWAIASNDVGREVATTEQYSTFWKIEARTGWRHRAEIRELFPGDEFAHVIAEVSRRTRRVPREGGRVDLTSVPLAV